MATLKELLNNKKTIRVVTHDGEFHADEVASIALLELFFPQNHFEVTRLPQETSQDILDQYDIVINIGKVLDPENCRFVHNKYETEKGTTGLIWAEMKSILGSECDICVLYLSIDYYVSKFDAHEKSIENSGEYRYTFSERILGTTRFEIAIKFAKESIKPAKKEAEYLYKIKQIASSAEVIDGFIFLPPKEEGEHYILWKEVINGQLMPDISGMVRYNPKIEFWEITLAPLYPGFFHDSYFTKGLEFDHFEWKKEVGAYFMTKHFAAAREKKSIMKIIKKYNEALENSKER